MSRDGLIPGWSDVVSKLDLDRFSPSQKRALLDFYRGSKKVALGKKRRAKDVFNGLNENQHFKELERDSSHVLDSIASLVRSSSERVKGRSN